ncbi:hypothetical protein I4U23_004151 [Adineta vaga]|nr:hypothetical protein I4U23_004151 [Adineta vaga]
MNSCESNTSKTLTTILSATNRCHLKKLCSHKCDDTIKHVSQPVQYALQHLTIGICTYYELNLILYHLPHLRTLALKKCNMFSLGGPNIVPSADLHYPQLTSLTMESCPYSADHLKTILSLTPSLIHLKLSSHGQSSFFLFDGTLWAKFIQAKLPHWIDSSLRFLLLSL